MEKSHVESVTTGIVEFFCVASVGMPAWEQDLRPPITLHAWHGALVGSFLPGLILSAIVLARD